MSRDPYDPQQHQIEVLNEISEGIAAIAMLLRDHLAQPAPPLDPDRLARALRTASPGSIDISDDMVLGDEYAMLAAAIVKAYEEEGEKIAAQDDGGWSESFTAKLGLDEVGEE